MEEDLINLAKEKGFESVIEKNSTNPHIYSIAIDKNERS